MAGNKRRMPDAPTPEMLKRMKMDVSAKLVENNTMMPPPPPPPSNGLSAKSKGKSRAVTVEDEEGGDGEDSMDVDVDADADFAPGNDADYFVEEDDEGRFFGGGLTSEQKTILNIFEKAGGEGEDGGAAADDVRCLCILAGTTDALSLDAFFLLCVARRTDSHRRAPHAPAV